MGGLRNVDKEGKYLCTHCGEKVIAKTLPYPFIIEGKVECCDERGSCCGWLRLDRDNALFCEYFGKNCSDVDCMWKGKMRLGENGNNIWWDRLYDLPLGELGAE